jgi:predicted TIM-barrel fold metal-dependent hydrolase
MDGVYDRRGKLDEQNTEFLIGNDYVLDVVKSYPNYFEAGVSINPQREDAIEEIARCAEAGARLVKVLPNAQQCDLGNHAYRAFYRALERHRLPLLSHVGYEFSLIGKDQSAGNPDRLRLPLDEGATVIAAHGCSYGLVFYEKFYPTLLDLVTSYPNFYSDISALTLPNRVGMLLRLTLHPEMHDRLLFGTDYPLPVFHWACWGRVRLRGMREILRANNRFDRQYLVCSQLGLRFRSFEESLGPNLSPIPVA